MYAVTHTNHVLDLSRKHTLLLLFLQANGIEVHCTNTVSSKTCEYNTIVGTHIFPLPYFLRLALTFLCIKSSSNLRPPTIPSHTRPSCSQLPRKEQGRGCISQRCVIRNFGNPGNLNLDRPTNLNNKNNETTLTGVARQANSAPKMHVITNNVAYGNGSWSYLLRLLELLGFLG